jgi:hypothetical protein
MIGSEDGDPSTIWTGRGTVACAADGDFWFWNKNEILEKILFSVALGVYSSISPF